MTPVRIKLNSTMIFVGFVTAWPTEYDISNKFAVSTIPCVDATRLLQNMLLASSAFGKLVLADSSLTNFYPMQVIEPAGITCVKTNTVLPLSSSLTGAEYSSSNYTVGATQMLAPGQSYNVTQAGWSNQNATTVAPKSIEFWIDGRAQKNASSIIHVIKQGSSAGFGTFNLDQLEVTISNTGLVGLAYSNIASNRFFGPFTTAVNGRPNVGANHIVVTTDSTNIYLYVNSVLSYTAALSVGGSTGPFNNLQSVTVSTGVSTLLFITQRYQVELLPLDMQLVLATQTN
jgi:hypothetical protein